MNYVLYMFSCNEGVFNSSPFLDLLLRILFGVDKRAGFWHAIDDEECEILK